MGFNKFFEVLGVGEKINEPIQPVTPTGKTPAASFGNVNTIPQSTFPVPPPIQQTADNPVEQSYLDHFMQFLEKNNIPGLDYWEFAITLHDMYEKFGSTVTESQLYEMSYTLFKAQGVTETILVQTAQKYLALIQEHKKEYDIHMSTEGSKDIQDKTTENKSLEQRIANSDQQIATLQQQIVGLQNQKNTDIATMQANQNFITEEQQNNEAKRLKFETAARVALEKVQGDITKIQQYLK